MNSPGGSYSVMKFGGTSVDNINEVATIVGFEAKKAQPIMVVSAYSGQTDVLKSITQNILQNPSLWSYQSLYFALEPVLDYAMKKAGEQCPGHSFTVLSSIYQYLVECINEVIREILSILDVLPAKDSSHITPEFRTYIEDRIIGLGEVFSAHILAKVLSTRTELARVFEDVSLVDIFNADPQSSPVLPDQKDAFFEEASQKIAAKIQAVLDRGNVPVVTGYMGYLPGGILKTIDRGYTDSTAALTAVALLHMGIDPEHIRLQIWKEVPGLMTADPRIVEPNYNSKTQRRAGDFKVAKVRSHASFTEAAELADLGGMKAINPNGIWILDGKGIELQVRSTFDPESSGTIITESEDLNERGIRFISGKGGQMMYRVKSNKMVEQNGVAAKIFNACAELGISVDAITTSGTTVSFSMSANHERKVELEERLSRIGSFELCENMALVCCIGNSMRYMKGLLRELSGILSDNDINIEFDCGDPDNNVTFVVNEADFKKAIKSLHQGVIEKIPVVADQGADI